MKRMPVSSSNLAAIGYDDLTQTLEVEFRARPGRRRAVWRYRPVSPQTVAALRGAPSIGSYFHSNIRNNSGLRAWKVS